MTTTARRTIRTVLNQATPGQVLDMLRRMLFGDMQERVEETIVLPALSATVDLEALTALRRKAKMVQSVRVTVLGAGTGSLGTFYVGDSGAVPTAAVAGKNGLCSLSADGKTLTFEGTISTLVIVYIPAAAVDIDSDAAIT